MQITTFTYTKADKSTSKRTLVTLVKPTTMYAGLDITELSTEDQALYTVAFEAARDAYNQKLAELASQFDMQHRYRQFKPENMSDVKTDEI